MKVIFAGPSLAGERPDRSGEIDFRPPAIFGDIEGAVNDGANVIGIVDGRFQQVQSVWHKEILSALAGGVQVLGAASMGALRAAECKAFGMIPIGKIARAYAEGRLWDDADVALVHEGISDQYRAITEPMVNVQATAERLVALGFITIADCAQLVHFAAAIHFSDRRVSTLFEPDSPLAWVAGPYATYHVDQKALDAKVLIDVVRGLSDQKTNREGPWRPRTSQYWKDARRLTLD